MNDEDIRAIVGRFAQLESEVVEIRRRLANVVREGKITSIDYETGLAEVEMDGLASRMIPWVQRAGSGVKDWDPPSVGERVTVLSPTGDPARGMVMPGGWSDENPAPDNVGGNRTIVVSGTVTIRAGGDIVLDAGGDVRVTAGGTVRVEAPVVEIDGDTRVTGEALTHNGRNVGDDHKHRDVVPGGDLTGVPN